MRLATFATPIHTHHGPQTPQPPPSFAYTPESLSSAAQSLITASVKVGDDVAAIPHQEATFATANQPLIDDENLRSTQGRILAFFRSSSPDASLRAVSLQQDVFERHARTDVFRVVDAVSQRSDVQDLPAESQLYLRRLREELARNGLALQDDDQEQLGRLMGLWLSAQELDGLSPSTLERFRTREEKGGGRPNLTSVLASVNSASVRRKYYIAWDNRLKDVNEPLLNEILQLRQESAELLGYRSFAESKSYDRMMSAEKVSDFLESMRGPLTELGQEELDELAALKEAYLQTVSNEQKDDSSIPAIFR
ncbi:hypothetical protein BJ170DRAFT_593723 [Xylariales sp. AK1849]|nr:hypothetical protein BJ170DRAFT_593723 [Xylariales sp. AK1849]